MAVRDEPPLPPPREEQQTTQEIKELTPRELIEIEGMFYGATTTELVLAISEAESHFRNVCNSKGCTYGIGPMQIVQSTFDEQCEGDVYNARDNIKCGYKMIANGDFWRWEPSQDKWITEIATSTRNEILIKCSCITYIRSRRILLPPKPTNASDLRGNTFPQKNGVILQNFNGVAHAGIIERIDNDGFWVRSANRSRCKITLDFVPFNDKTISGFYRYAGGQ